MFPEFKITLETFSSGRAGGTEDPFQYGLEIPCLIGCNKVSKEGCDTKCLIRHPKRVGDLSQVRFRDEIAECLDHCGHKSIYDRLEEWANGRGLLASIAVGDPLTFIIIKVENSCYQLPKEVR